MNERFEQRSFVVRYLTLFGGEALSKVCVFAAFAYLARTFGPQKFGVIELALSVTVFCALGAESGLGSYGARMVEQSPSALPQLIPRVMLLRGMLSLPAYLIILTLSERYGMPGIGVLALYGIIVLLTPFFTQWVFQGLRQMQWVAAGGALRYILFSAIVLVSIQPQSRVTSVAAAEVAGAAALVIFNTIMLRRVVKVKLDWRGAPAGALRLFRETWFLGASDIAWATMWYAPTLLLGWMAWGRTAQVAWLAAPIRIVMALHTFVWLYFFNMIPNLSKELHHHGVEAWRMLIRRSLSSAMWAPCLIALTGTLLAPVIVPIVYGGNYSRSVLPLQIIVWMIPVVWLSGHFRFSLIAAGHQHLEFAASAIAGVTTAGLAYLGIKEYGVIGAASALLAGGVVNGVLAGVFMSRAIGSVPLDTAARPVLACGAAALIGLAVGSLTSTVLGAAAALLVYGGVAASQWNFTRLRLAWEGRLD